MRPLPLLRLGRAAARFLRDERGSMTIEFVLVGPAFIYLFLSSFELGMLMMRQVMLDRAMDMAVRHVRLGHFDVRLDDDGTYGNLHRSIKATICQNGRNIPFANCMRDLRLDMQQVDPRDWARTSADVTSGIDCADRSANESVPASTFRPGLANELVVLRACEYFDPFFPNLLMGKRLAGTRGYYALTSTYAYAVEPSLQDS